MKYRKLRIAWSVAWGLLAVLLCVFWVRSYSSLDTVWWPLSKQTATWKTRFVNLFTGRIYYSKGSNLDAGTPMYGGYSVDLKSSKQTRPKLIARHIGKLAKSVPYWPFATMPLALVSLPWLPYRFSLRTLLIVTTLIAVVLGIIVWMTRAG